jgi:hypothetical protein
MKNNFLPNFKIINISLIFTLIIFFGSSGTGKGQTQSQTFSSSGSFTVPAGVTMVQVECWGGGGSGGSLDGGNTQGGRGGGGGGAYSKSVLTLVSGNSYTVTAGAGSSGTSPGGDSWFGSITTILAKGGNSNLGNATGAAGGSASGGVGDIKNSGGNGANGSGTSYGGGGGSSAGIADNGNSATNQSGATAPAGGGNGGDGRSSTSGDGLPGSIPGGGGGGALKASNGGPQSGGNGANGQVIVSWSAPNTWTGSVSVDWNNSGNWTVGIPDRFSNVTIPSAPANQPHITSDASTPAHCNNLVINSGASLMIEPGKALTVNGLLTNNSGTSGLVIKSDENGTGSLLHSTSGVDAIVERYLTDIEWHFIGIPVEEAMAGAFHLPSGHSDIYLRTHDESTNTWLDWIVPLTTPLIQGRGYACYVGSTQSFHQPETVEFTGKLNSGNYTTGQDDYYALQYTSGRGLNLISNPYPSALQANIHTWTKSNIANKVYVWDASYGNYRYWNGIDGSNDDGYGTLTGGTIPSMQAFFVEATGTSPAIAIPQGSRIHSNQAYYKSSEVPENTLRLDVSANAYEDAIFINFNPLASDAYDVDFDVEKMFGLAEAPQLYSIITGKNLSINSMPEFTEGMSIPLGYECGVSGNTTIEAFGMEGFEGGIVLYLEDLKSGLIHNLKENPVYTFFHISGDDPERFILHFGNPASMETSIESSIQIYSGNNSIVINRQEPATMTVLIYDMMGRQVSFVQIPFDEVSSTIDLNVKTGAYIVKTITNQESLSKMVFIK